MGAACRIDDRNVAANERRKRCKRNKQQGFAKLSRGYLMGSTAALRMRWMRCGDPVTAATGHDQRRRAAAKRKKEGGAARRIVQNYFRQDGSRLPGSLCTGPTKGYPRAWARPMTSTRACDRCKVAVRRIHREQSEQLPCPCKVW